MKLKNKLKTKTVIIISVSATMIVFLLLGFLLFRKNVEKVRSELTAQMVSERQQFLKEEKEKEEKAALLEKRVEEVTAYLSLSEEEKKALEEEKNNLLNKIEAMLVEDVYYFDSASIFEEIKEIGELATAEYIYTNVGTLDASKKLFKTDFDIPLTNKTVVISMNGKIKVGIDVEKIKITSDENTKTIYITIPKAKLISNELDEDSTMVYNEKDGIFNKVTMEDSSSLRTQIKNKAEESATKNGVYEQAIDNAKMVLRCFLEAIPGLKETYKIVFK